MDAAPLLAFSVISCLKFKLHGNTFIISRLRIPWFNWVPCKYRELCRLYGLPPPKPQCRPPSKLQQLLHESTVVNLATNFLSCTKLVRDTADRFRVVPRWRSSSILVASLQQGISDLGSLHWCFRGPQLLSDCIPLLHQSKHCLSSGNIFTAP